MHRTIGVPEWPRDPYKGLANYEFEDQRLFAGRDAEIDTCAQLLANAQTKLLVLHGQTGCGKSSFLRAGLIPALEEHGAGYLFLRRLSATVPGHSDPSFIRCGADPLARIAEEIFVFAGQPLTVPTAMGPKQIDLSSARLGCDETQAFVNECADPHRLFTALERLTGAVPHTLVLILDQVEEIITLNPSDKGNRSRFARFVKELATSDIDMRFVLAIRKDHSGQFIESVQVGSEMSTAFRTFFLTDLSREGIREAILRPTLKTLPHAGSMPGPFDVYRFAYAPGVVDRIIDDLDALIPAGAMLPVMQIVCRDLYEQVAQQPEPRVIEMPLYEQGGIKGRVKRHLIQSLRAVLVRHKERSTDLRDISLKWLRVLQKLVQEEGDGRVHTTVVPRSTLLDWAAKEGIGGDVGQVIDGLAEPKVLIVRRFSVFAPGAVAEHELFCLGHDMVGIALREALSDAVQSQYVSGLERKRLTQIVGAVTGALVVAAVVGLLIVRADAVRVQKVGTLLAQSSLNRGTDVLVSLASARQAQSLAHKLLNDDERANRAMATLLSGLPITLAPNQSAPPLDADSLIPPTFALDKRVGLATLRTRGMLETYVLQGRDIRAQTFTAPAPLVATAGKLNLQSLQVSDANPDLLLALYQGYRPDSAGGVIAFPQSGTPTVFSESAVIDALARNVNVAQDTHLFGLSGDLVVLFSPIPGTRSMHLATVRVDNGLGLVPFDAEIMEAFPDSSQIDGRYVVSYLHPETTKIIEGIASQPVVGVAAKDLSMRAASRHWNVKGFKAVQKCMERNNPERRCDVTVISDLQQPGIVALGLWEVRYGRYGANPRGYISDLFLIDLAQGKSVEVDLRLSSAARQACSVAGGVAGTTQATPTKSQNELTDDDVPTFVMKSENGLLLGYASRNAAQLIDVSLPEMACTELFIPNTKIDAWRTADGNRKLLGLTRNEGGFVWSIQTKADTGSSETGNRLREVCGKELQRFVVRPGDPPAQTAARKKSYAQICQNEGT